jgi:hypothetical protein
MRGGLIALAAVLAFAGFTGAERAGGLLQCVGADASNHATEHTVVLYSKRASVDGLNYELGKDAGQYALVGHTVLSEVLHGPLTLIQINRVTGDYQISIGVGDVSLRESGHCDKVRAKL